MLFEPFSGWGAHAPADCHLRDGCVVTDQKKVRVATLALHIHDVIIMSGWMPTAAAASLEPPWCWGSPFAPPVRCVPQPHCCMYVWRGQLGCAGPSCDAYSGASRWHLISEAGAVRPWMLTTVPVVPLHPPDSSWLSRRSAEPV